MDLILAAEDLKEWRAWVRRQLLLPHAWAGHSSVPAYGNNWNISSSWYASLLAFGLELHISSSGLPTCRLRILGLLSLHNHVSQFIVNLSFPFSMCVCIYIHTSICVCTHTNTKTHPFCSVFFFLFGEPNKYFHKLSLIFKTTT